MSHFKNFVFVHRHQRELSLSTTLFVIIIIIIFILHTCLWKQKFCPTSLDATGNWGLLRNFRIFSLFSNTYTNSPYARIVSVANLLFTDFDIFRRRLTS